MSGSFLVAVDFSPLTDKVLAQAVDLARGQGRRIDLIHVDQPVNAPTMGHPAARELFEHLARPHVYGVADLQRLMDDKVPEAMRGSCTALRGSPAELIVARAEGYDMVVLGTHGRTGLSAVLLGSVAERVVRLAPVPVLVVR